MEGKIKAMQGSKHRGNEVREWLKSQGGKECDLVGFQGANEKALYYINDKGLPECVDIRFKCLVEVVELPEKEKREEKFKPFDRVLCKYTANDPWRPGIYANTVYDEKEDCDIYYILGHGYMRICIPYEGNEHLNGRI